MLFVENISFVIDRRIIFEKLTFNISNGNLLKIMGSNGCGKTSLLKILAFLYKRSSGNIFWNGNLIDDDKYYVYTNNIIFVSCRQGLSLLLTPFENFDFYLSLVTDKKKICINDAFHKMQIENCIDVKCFELSSGQLQRVVLSRLIIQNSKIWILDEPFSYLDYNGIILFNNIVIDFLNSGGIVILTDHSDSIKFFSNIYVLDLMKYK